MAQDSIQCGSVVAMGMNTCIRWRIFWPVERLLSQDLEVCVPYSFITSNMAFINFVFSIFHLTQRQSSVLYLHIT
jgi:hypothetical protein